MKIKIKETGEIKELIVIDKKTNCEWTLDLINAADFWDEEEQMTVMSQDDFKWWENYISEHEQTEEDIQKLADELEDINFEEICHCSPRQYIIIEIGKNTGNDMESHRREALEVMGNIRREYLK